MSSKLSHKSKSTAKTCAAAIPEDYEHNEENQKLCFKIFDSKHNEQMDFPALVQFYKLGWSFLGIDTSHQGLISEKMIDDALVKLPFPIPMIRDEQYKLDQIRDLLTFKHLMNIKQYFAWF